jgi:hypothetical protein
MKLLIISIILLLLVFSGCDDNSSGDNNSQNNNESCGNSQLDLSEECDDQEFGQATCETVLPSSSGVLNCNADCTIDTTGCEISQVCGDGVIGEEEECDLTDFGVLVCADMGNFDGGELTCNESCIISTSQCISICSLENFEECSVFDENDCCPKNGMESKCLGQTSDGFCFQSCEDDNQCGFSMECRVDFGNYCFLRYCGPAAENGALNAPCSLGSKEGYCVPQNAATDQFGICMENGTAQHQEECVKDPDNQVFATILSTQELSLQCDVGFCITEEGATSGKCVSLCDPLSVYETTASNDATSLWAESDPCDPGFNCINFSAIIDASALEDGSSNPNFLFRSGDIGLCYAQEAASNDEYGVITCDLVTGRTIITGESCPDLPISIMGVPLSHSPSTCLPLTNGSLIGVCAYVEESADQVAIGDTCDPEYSRYYGLLPASQCTNGSVCHWANPLNEALTEDLTLACMKPCNADDGEDSNPSCDGLSDGLGNPFICLTMSKYFTPDHELPTKSTTNGDVTENAPSPQGYCIPQQTN